MRAEGVLEGIRQNLAGLLLLPGSMPRTPRSEKYLDYVRSPVQSYAGNMQRRTIAFGRNGIATKASDYTCVLLCHRHHSEFHFSGKESFERTHRVYLVEVAFNLLHRYATGALASMVLNKSDAS